MKEAKDYTLLVVEDDDILLKITESCLKGAGFNILSAVGGDVALRVLDQNRIDLVVSDIMMPNGDGISLLKELRRRHPELPRLIFVSGFSNHSAEECLKLGAYNLVHKPFNRKTLIAAVWNALGRPELMAANQENHK